MNNWLTRKNSIKSVQNNNISDYISNFHYEIDNWFNEVFRNFGFVNDRFNNMNFIPKVDFLESDREYKIIVDVPGVNENDLKIDLQGNILHISGDKKQDTNNNQTNYHYFERFHGSFKRSFTLPEDSNFNHIDASFKNGVLTIIIPRRPELKPVSRKINIRKHY